MHAQQRDAAPGRALCLNMIVKNEAAIIERCLAAAAPVIASWVICDTGSSDGTPDRIRAFFAARAIPGQLHTIAFDDFAQARNEALAHCLASPLAFDYVLFADADMELVVESADFASRLGADAYRLRQRNAIAYWNLRMLRRGVAARYVGPTHEHLAVEGKVEQLDDLWFRDHADGGNRLDKFARDIALLERALASEPGNARHLFYLAQSQFDAGRTADALRTYQRRIDAGGWDEERWYAALGVARCHAALGDDARCADACLAAYNMRPSRGEPLHLAARRLRERGLYDAALLICEAGLRIAYPAADLLFVDEFVHHHGFDEETSICGFYSHDEARYAAGERACEALATRRAAPAITRETARRNGIHYARQAAELFGAATLVRIGVDVAPPFHALNPSLADCDGNLRTIVRLANYRVVNGVYEIGDDAGIVRTRNLLGCVSAEGVMTDVRELALAEATRQPPLFASRWSGFEDCRLFAWHDRLWCTATVRDRDPSMRCQIVLMALAGDGSIVSVDVLHGPEPHLHQKNWLPFVHADALHFVYRSDPTTILRYDDKTRDVECVFREDAPRALDHLRGGASPVRFDDGWLYVAHESVDIEGRGRCYSHRLVQLDAGFRVAAVTRPFYFTRRGIEFVAGLCRQGDKLQLGLGVDDREAWLAQIDVAAVRDALAAGAVSR
jgi:tetratricopeptide (TPR) repeat protein